jgi:hypothetical protein
MKKTLSLIGTILLLQLSFAQTDTLRGEAAKQLLRKINLDTTKFLNAAGAYACKCIDSIGLNGKSSTQISADIFSGINKQVTSYQLALKIYHSMIDTGNNSVLSLDFNKKFQ